MKSNFVLCCIASAVCVSPAFAANILLNGSFNGFTSWTCPAPENTTCTSNNSDPYWLRTGTLPGGTGTALHLGGWDTTRLDDVYQAISVSDNTFYWLGFTYGEYNAYATYDTGLQHNDLNVYWTNNLSSLGTAVFSSTNFFTAQTAQGAGTVLTQSNTRLPKTFNSGAGTETYYLVITGDDYLQDSFVSSMGVFTTSTGDGSPIQVIQDVAPDQWAEVFPADAPEPKTFALMALAGFILFAGITKMGRTSRGNA